METDHSIGHYSRLVALKRRSRSELRSTDTLERLIAALARRQRPDGSWVNDNDRWMEGDPNLVTGYALMALSYCKK